jgi:hypothetical protein
MRTSIDVLRSLAKHLNLTLHGWEVYVGGTAADFKPPTVRVQFLEGGFGGPAGRNDYRRPFTITMYLEGGDAFDAWERLLAGYEAERGLIDAFSGNVGPGHKGRIPLYDYDGVGPEGVATVRGERDYIRVEGFSSQVVPDGEDPRFVVVTASATATWSAAVGRWPDAPILAGVGASLGV